MQRVDEENKWGEVSKIIVTVRDANSKDKLDIFLMYPYNWFYILQVFRFIVYFSLSLSVGIILSMFICA